MQQYKRIRCTEPPRGVEAVAQAVTSPPSRWMYATLFESVNCAWDRLEVLCEQWAETGKPPERIYDGIRNKAELDVVVTAWMQRQLLGMPAECVAEGFPALTALNHTLECPYSTLLMLTRFFDLSAHGWVRLCDRFFAEEAADTDWGEREVPRKAEGADECQVLHCAGADRGLYTGEMDAWADRKEFVLTTGPAHFQGLFASVDNELFEWELEMLCRLRQLEKKWEQQL